MTTATRPPARRPERRRGGANERSGRRRSRVRWRRIPGRIILAVCFVVGAGALALAVVPFTAVAEDSAELRCGPPVFEVLMPPDPAFDDVEENVGCADPAGTRLIIAGGVLAGVLVITAVAEWRTRRGSTRRDTRWLASSPSRRSGSSSPRWRPLPLGRGRRDAEAKSRDRRGPTAVAVEPSASPSRR